MATKKWAFRTPVSEPVRHHTKAGSHIEDVKAMRLDEHGNEVFYVASRTNVYEQIQAYKDQCDINNIIEMCVDTGDMNILNQIKNEYMDLTEVPKNLIDAQNTINRAERDFYTLPLEIREKFDNNFRKYMNEVGKDEWMIKMGFVQENKEEEPLPAEEKGAEEE